MSGSSPTPALADADIVDIRRYCGYAMDDAALDVRIAGLTPTMVAVVETQLTQLRSLELALYGASDNLDTNRAAVWYRNTTEVSDREALFYTWRLKLCNLLGVVPGNFLGVIGIGAGDTGVAPAVFVV